MEAPLSLPSSPVSLRPLHLLLLLLLGLALVTLLLFSYGAFPSGDTPLTRASFVAKMFMLKYTM